MTSTEIRIANLLRHVRGGWLVVVVCLGAVSLARFPHIPAAPAQLQIDVNAASAAQLSALPDVGPKLATRIIDHRQRNGPFRDVESLLDVRGIGPATIQKLESILVVDARHALRSARTQLATTD